LELAFCKDISIERFIPYIQLHEFETLIFANPTKLNLFYINNGDDVRIQRLCQITANQKDNNPELINNGEMTAPSKRIIQEFEHYESNKPVIGARVAAEIGMKCLRNRCHHFAEWITKLEQLELLGNL
jgi:hypothetical protein